MNISVPAQTDSEYARIASNQCSWAAAEFAVQASKLRHAFHKDKTAFLSIYKQCLEKASILRSKTKENLFGENIDTPILESHYKQTMELSILEHFTFRKNFDNDFLSILHPDLKREFYTRTYFERPVEKILDQVLPATSLLVSRHGQSLTIIPYYGRYLICDSHLHEAGIASKEETINHILMDHGGHLHLTCILVL